MASKMIGLDLGAREVRVCEVHVGFSGVELKQLYTAPVIPEPDVPLVRTQALTAAALLAEHKLTHEPLACALPGPLMSTITLTFPFNKPSKLNEVLGGELDEVLPFEVEDLIYADQLIGPHGEEGAELLVAYGRFEPFSELFEELTLAGLNPKLLTLSALTFEALELPPPKQGGAQVLLDLGERASEWVMISGGKTKRLHRVEVGGEAVTQRLADTFKVALEPAESGKLREASLFSQLELSQLQDKSLARAQAIHQAVEGALRPLIQELKRSFAAYEGETGEEICELLLMGGGAELKGLRAYLSAQLGVAVHFAPAPEDLKALAPQETQGATRHHVALSMAYALAKRLDRRLINFRRGAFAYQGDADAMKLAILWVVASLLISLSLYGLQVSYELDELNAEVLSLEEETKGLSTQLMGNDSFDIEALKARVKANKAVSAEVPEVSALDTLGELSAKVSKETEVELELFNVQLPPDGRGRLELRGKTLTVGDVGVVISALEEGACFSKVKKDSVSKSVDGRTSFRLTAAAQFK